ncbi:MAG: class I SAM-dependent methyltransferase [Candidatus Parabeggiatoa sp. nov. 1]|nr:MAG: class I SAM-dependent methyltransferase [Gammaproteobacteria bacterium]
MEIDEQSRWHLVKELMGNQRVLLGKQVTHGLKKSPAHILHYLSYYKFAAKMVGSNKRVLDVGCGEGLGTWILAKECGQVKGVDFAQEVINVGQTNWSSQSNISFECSDFLTLSAESWDAVVNFDVIEQISPENVQNFMTGIINNLAEHGITIVGTPNLNSQAYVSEISKLGHVNVYSPELLEEEMRRYFEHVFLFCANNEVIHAGFLPFAHYLIVIGCKKRKSLLDYYPPLNVPTSERKNT